MNNVLTCYIIEDEPIAQEVIQNYIARVPYLKLLQTFSSPIDATPYLEKEKPDILFLDINLPEMHGLSLIPLLHYRPAIILTTAYDEFALKGYELDVDDYLLKPIAFERFYKAVTKVMSRLEASNQVTKDNSVNATPQQDDYIFVKVGHRIQKVVLADIQFVQGMKDYLQIHTSGGKVMVLMNFAKMSELLPGEKFVRVHKSFMVAIDKIDHIERSRITIGKEIIPVSEKYSEAFFQKLKWKN